MCSNKFTKGAVAIVYDYLGPNPLEYRTITMDELLEQVQDIIDEISETIARLQEELTEYLSESNSDDQDTEKLMEDVFSDNLFDDDMVVFVSDEDSDESESDS